MASFILVIFCRTEGAARIFVPFGVTCEREGTEDRRAPEGDVTAEDGEGPPPKGPTKPLDEEGLGLEVDKKARVVLRESIRGCECVDDPEALHGLVNVKVKYR